MGPIVANLWVNDGLVEEAVAFWTSLSDDGRVVQRSTYGEDAGEWAGQTMAIWFELLGQTFTAINGAHTRFEPNESVSFAIPCETQEEVDRLWDTLTEGGEPGPCGWLKDRYGFSWQVFPTVLHELLADPDPEKVRRVTECFMAVDKQPLSIADLEAAYAGRSSATA